MATANVYDVIIIGAGVEGSATAYYLTSRYTKNVLLLEQFAVGHTRGSSHGGSRITRKAYDKPYYVRMMDEAFELWAEIEKNSKKELYKKTGMLALGDSKMNSYIQSLKMNRTPHKVLTGAQANKKWPNQLTLPDDYICVTEEDGGILRASLAVSTLQSLFVQNGGRLVDGQKVTNINPSGPIVTIETNKGDVYRSKKVIVTAGAWTNKVLKSTGLQLPLKVIRTEVLYWPVEDERLYSSNAFPVFFADFEKSKTAYYGLPIEEYPGLFKACLHYGPEVDPDRRDVSPHSVTHKKVAEFVRNHFKGVKDEPAVVELCMYTITADDDPILDVHPKYSNVIIGAGFSGHGFKLAPVVGKILSELALEQVPPSYDLSPFKINKIRSSL